MIAKIIVETFKGATVAVAFAMALNFATANADVFMPRGQGEQKVEAPVLTVPETPTIMRGDPSAKPVLRCGGTTFNMDTHEWKPTPQGVYVWPKQRTADDTMFFSNGVPCVYGR